MKTNSAAIIHALGTYPQDELLLCCARTCMNADTAERIRILLRKDIDWAYLLEKARRHQIRPLLYRSLNTMCPETVPEAFLAELRNNFQDNARRNHFLTRELLKLLHVFERHGIHALPFKGPTLAVSIYGDLALRQFWDLDLLVHDRDFARTADLLVSQEFRRRREFDWESSFVRDDGEIRINLDLHRGLVPQRFHFALDFERLWKHRKLVSIDGTTIPTLSPEDMLIILCVQVAKDMWASLYKHKRFNSQLLKICDIAELLRAHPDMDWGKVMGDTRRLGGQRILFFGLRLARELLGAALPKDVLQRMSRHPSLDALTARVYTQFFHTADEDAATPLTRDRFYYAIRERVRDKVFPYLHYGVSLFVPSEKDRAFLPLPGCLSGLYYVIRPLRIMRDYGLRLLRAWSTYLR